MVGIVALFVSGPVGWALVGVVLTAGAVAFGDTLVKFTQGKASLADLALDALGLIPGSAGAIRLAGLGTRLAEAGPRLVAMARNLPERGRIVLGGLREAKGAFGESFRGADQLGSLFSKGGLARSNLDILHSGGGLARTEETVASVARKVEVSLENTNVHIIDDIEEARYLDAQDAYAYTPVEKGGSEIRLGPASFVDEETLGATLAHEAGQRLQSCEGSSHERSPLRCP
ncbi:MAG TPA: hypothetical protein VII47_00535 [Actinomycetota bacterium]